MYISRDLTRQQVSYCTTSDSVAFSFHLRVFRFLQIYSFAIFLCNFTSTFTFTPKYFTVLVHFISPIYSSFSAVRISDFFLFKAEVVL